MAIKYITFEVSNNCNMDCQFCFSDWRIQDYAVNTDVAKQTIQKLREEGLEGINFTGGEPLLRKDLSELVKYSKSLGLTTIITTNGILLERSLESLVGSLDFVGLPLDSSVPDIHNTIRPTHATNNHYNLVCSLIDMLNEHYEGIGIKINTVVNNQNRNTVLGIGEQIDGKIVSWKLSHFVASGYGKHFQKEFDIPIDEYTLLVEDCRTAYPCMNIISAVAHDCDEGCRVISPEGQLQMPSKNGLINIGILSKLSRDQISFGLDEKMNLEVLRGTYK